MKNIMIKEDVYSKLKSFKGDRSFSDAIGLLLAGEVESRRRNLRGYFGSIDGKEAKDAEKIITELIRGAKGRLF